MANADNTEADELRREINYLTGLINTAKYGAPYGRKRDVLSTRTSGNLNRQRCHHPTSTGVSVNPVHKSVAMQSRNSSKYKITKYHSTTSNMSRELHNEMQHCSVAKTDSHTKVMSSASSEHHLVQTLSLSDKRNNSNPVTREMGSMAKNKTCNLKERESAKITSKKMLSNVALNSAVSSESDSSDCNKASLQRKLLSTEAAIKTMNERLKQISATKGKGSQGNGSQGQTSTPREQTSTKSQSQPSNMPNEQTLNESQGQGSSKSQIHASKPAYTKTIESDRAVSHHNSATTTKHPQSPYKLDRTKQNILLANAPSTSLQASLAGSLLPQTHDSFQGREFRSAKHKSPKVIISKYKLKTINQNLPVKQRSPQIITSRYQLIKKQTDAVSSPAGSARRRRSGSFPNANTSNYSTQALAKVIVSKYKIQKLSGQPHSPIGYNSPMPFKSRFQNRKSLKYQHSRQHYYVDETHGHYRPQRKYQHYSHYPESSRSLYHVPQHQAYDVARHSRRQSHHRRGWQSRWQCGSQWQRFSSFYEKKSHINRRLKLLNKTKKSQFKLDRRCAGVKNEEAKSFVMINGLLYKSSKQKLARASTKPSDEKSGPLVRKIAAGMMKTVSVRGVKFRVDPSGRTLQRVSGDAVNVGESSQKKDYGASGGNVTRLDIGGVTYVQTKPGTLERLTSYNSRAHANRAIHRSIATAAAKYKRNISTRSRQYCLFYNRFGKCNRREECPYLHDPEKVAVCKRFLCGTCTVIDCPFSHKVSPDKMPVCSYFMRGICNRDECPYLHVNVSRDAEVCPDFLRGYCKLGAKCKRKHTMDCPDYSRSGKCPKGDNCKLKHRKRPKNRSSRKRSLSEFSKTRKQSDAESSKTHKAESKSTPDSTVSSVQRPSSPVSLKHKLPRPDEDVDPSIPFKHRVLPAFIALTSNEDDADSHPSPECPKSASRIAAAPLQIKPRF